MADSSPQHSHDSKQGHHHEHVPPAKGPHHDDDSFTEVNRAHWNQYAASYTIEQWQRDLIQKATAFIRENIDWIGVDFIDPSSVGAAGADHQRSVRVLDYACGPGTMTHALAGRASEYVGIDLSENMVKAYNARFNPDDHAVGSLAADEQADAALNAHAVVGNLLTTHAPSSDFEGPEFHHFDLAVVGFGYHHFIDISLATRRLVQRLRPGGVFMIIDFIPHEAEKPGSDVSQHTVAHNGFSAPDLRRYFEGAGLSDFKIVQMDGEVSIRSTTTRTPFLAVGRKRA